MVYSWLWYQLKYSMWLVRRWWYDDYDEMSWLCELWDHVKVRMIQGLMWTTFVHYYDMIMISWFHKWRVIMKEHSHAIRNEIMI